MEKKMIAIVNIRKAMERIRERVIRTPILACEDLESLGIGKIYFKPENFQRTGSFKVRGAMNKILSLTDEDRKKGVIAASSGNHGLGVAYAAKELGVAATIVMPLNAPRIKREKTEALGGKVILHGYTSVERYEKVYELIEKKGYTLIHSYDDEELMAGGYTLIHSYDDEELMAGQGTLGLEIMENQRKVDRVIVPMGGGGLISGVASAVKGIDPSVEVIGVETEAVPRFTVSLSKGEPTIVPMGETFADGLRVVEPGRISYQVVSSIVDHVLTVNEREIREAVQLIYLKGKLVVEPSAAVGLAAVLQGKIKGKPTDHNVFVISGGNVDQKKILEIFS